MKKILPLILFYFSFIWGCFSATSEVCETFLSGDNLWYGEQKIPTAFSANHSLEDYCMSGEGNALFAKVIYFDQTIKEQYVGDSHNITYFESAWKPTSVLEGITKQYPSVNPTSSDYMSRWAQRGHIFTTQTHGLYLLKNRLGKLEDHAVRHSEDNFKITIKQYPKEKEVDFSPFNLPYNFKHSEHYFLDYVHTRREPIIQGANPQFVVLHLLSTNSSCENCFHSLSTLLSGWVFPDSGLPSLKQSFLEKVFGAGVSPDIPTSILYTTAKFPSYRNSEVTKSWINAQNIQSSQLDLNVPSTSFFINHAYPLHYELEKQKRELEDDFLIQLLDENLLNQEEESSLISGVEKMQIDKQEESKFSAYPSGTQTKIKGQSRSIGYQSFHQEAFEQYAPKQEFKRKVLEKASQIHQNGEVSGAKNEQKRIARNLLSKGMKPNDIVEVTGLSLEDVQSLQKKRLYCQFVVAM